MHFVEAKGILSNKNGMNIYRGCSHGCIYCDTRSKCYGFTHDFEDIEVKINAPELLESTLAKKKKACMIGTGSMCDPYLHIEEELGLTRRCLEIIDKYEFGATLITKSSRVLRDLDILKSINNHTKCVVQMTLTTYDEQLCRVIEPNVSTTNERFETLMKLKEAGIPTVVWLCPILPYINDTEENIRGILDYCTKADVKGVLAFGIGMTLREGNREYYYEALDKHFPGLKSIYQREYGYQYSISSPNEKKLMNIVRKTCRDNGIMYSSKNIFEYLNVFPEKYEQMSFL